ncbi:MAG: methyltransferase domain-containing protein [Chloroflexota bacterium]|nr:methyltransferase domain-containing protein [Chloroflexota bacterium]
MYQRLLDHLVCPACATALEVDVFATQSGDGEQEIVEGLLRCARGEHGYPIVRAIPRLLPDAFETFRGEVQRFDVSAATTAAREFIQHSLAADAGGSAAYDRRTRESFSNEWEHHEVGDRTWGYNLEDRVDRYFLQSVHIPIEELDGKVMLDAGCGNGSQSVAYTAFGLEVIAIDLSSGLERGHEFRRKHPGARPDRVHFVQADLQHPPLPPSSVDLIHSAGVLHHTPDTKATFRRLTPLVRPGGTCYIWVYKYERVVTPIVNTLRAVTTRLPPRQFAVLARVAAEPFRLFCRLVDRLGVRSYRRLSRREAALAVTDIFGAPFAHYHSIPEVEAWLKSEGFDETWPVNETRRGFGVCGRRTENGPRLTQSHERRGAQRLHDNCR